MAIANAAKTKSAAIKKGKVKRSTRAERNDRTRAALISAATEIVGEHGFEEASIARITERVGIAQGTFYNHFSSRKDLLDLLLPSLTREMMSEIGHEVDTADNDLEREIARFRGYFRFVQRTPAFARILHEAEYYSPDIFQARLDNIHRRYCRTLTPSLKRRGYSERQIDLIAAMLLGIRNKLTRHLVIGGRDSDEVLHEAIDAYRLLLVDAVFKE